MNAILVCSLMASVAPLLMLATPSSKIVARVIDSRASSFSEQPCEGCQGDLVNDPIEGIVDGVVVKYKADDFDCTGFLTSDDGVCVWREIPPNTEKCVEETADTHCTFYVTYYGHHANQFRDDYVGPCNWSGPAGGGGQEIWFDTEFIGFCDNLNVWLSVRFFKEAIDCTTGTRVAEIKFGGTCWECGHPDQ